MSMDEIPKEKILKWGALYIMGFFGLIGLWWNFNDHFLSIREHTEYKDAVAADVLRIGNIQQWVVEHKLSRDAFEDHIVQDASRMDRVEKDIDDFREKVTILSKRLDELCKKK